MKRIEVVAGIIFDDVASSVLLALRKPEQHQGDRWEFPGGKLDSQEGQRDGLCRELFEELGVSVLKCHYRSTIEHDYSDKHVCLHFWDVFQFSGKPHPVEGQLLRWVAIEQLDTYTFPDANQPIVRQLRSAQGAGSAGEDS